MRLKLCPEPQHRRLPWTDTLTQLAPLLESVDYHSVPDLLATQVAFIHGSQACFGPDHVKALQAASHLQTLCISDSVHVMVQQQGITSLVSSIPTIANMRSLTKLHLTTSSRQPDFGPLRQLTCLRDLALQCWGSSSHCAGVLHSNKACLQRVSIASESWADTTYVMIAGAANLEAVIIKVHTLTDTTAIFLAQVGHPRSLQVLLTGCMDMPASAFLLLSSGSAQITALELWNVSSTQCQQLQTMLSLQSLTLLKPKLTVADNFHHCQPSLTSPHLVSVFAMSHGGVQNLVNSFPSLQHLAFQLQLGAKAPAGIRTLCTKSLIALTGAANLRFLILEGVQELSDKKIRTLVSQFQEQQEAGQTQRPVRLQLPDRTGTRGTLRHTKNLHFPFAWRDGSTAGKLFILPFHHCHW